MPNFKGGEIEVVLKKKNVYHIMIKLNLVDIYDLLLYNNHDNDYI